MGLTRDHSKEAVLEGGRYLGLRHLRIRAGYGLAALPIQQWHQLALRYSGQWLGATDPGQVVARFLRLYQQVPGQEWLDEVFY